jgi:hypothetical protein
VALVALAVLAGALGRAGRDGYSPDEEFTLFAVRGIAADGVPRLPSGLLYDRGIAYSYASWAGGVVGGQRLPTYRAVAALSAALAVVALAAWVQNVAGPLAAVYVAVFTVLSLPFWATATSARFYAPFLLLYAFVLWCLSVSRSQEPEKPERPEKGAWPLFRVFAGAAVCRWTHELGFTLAAVSVAALLVAPPPARRRWVGLTVAIVAGLVFAQIALFAVHYVAPTPASVRSSPASASSFASTMIQRFFVWQVVNLVEWPLHPFDFFEHIAHTWPLLTSACLSLLVARAAGAGRPRTSAERGVHALWIGWVLFFGVIDSGITVNYLLLPITMMLAAMAIDLAALTRGRTPIALAVMGLVAWEQWGSPAHAPHRLEAARPAIVLPAESAVRDAIARAPLVACTDELACLLLTGRVDVWLALDPFLRTRFIVSRNGREEGVYAGTPVRSTLATLPAGTVVVDVFKELPTGNSRTFVPRALDAEAVSAVMLLETDRLRVLEIRPSR